MYFGCATNSHSHVYNHSELALEPLAGSARLRIDLHFEIGRGVELVHLLVWSSLASLVLFIGSIASAVGGPCVLNCALGSSGSLYLSAGFYALLTGAACAVLRAEKTGAKWPFLALAMIAATSSYLIARFGLAFWLDRANGLHYMAMIVLAAIIAMPVLGILLRGCRTAQETGAVLLIVGTFAAVGWFQVSLK